MNWIGWITSLIQGFNDFVLYYFLALNSIYFLFFLVSLGDVMRYVRRIFHSDDQQILQSEMTWPISILIPAFNEEKTIVETVRSLLRARYPEFEVIVVSDGSTDRTVQTLVEAFRMQRADRVFRRSLDTRPIRAVYRSPSQASLVVVEKERGGKSDALNAGINLSRFPLFCSFDADSIIEENALLRLVRPFLERPRETVAAGGIVRIANGCEVRGGRMQRIAVPDRLIPIVQVVEYLREFLIGRVSWSRLHSVMIVSGAFGLYRKDEVIRVGGYHASTDTEDLELIVRLHKHLRWSRRKYRVVFLPDPVCWTEVPASVPILMRQRNRWHRGLIQSLLLHRGMFLNPRYGTVGLFAFPFFCFFEMLGPLIEFFGYVSVGSSYLLGMLDPHFLLLFVTVAIFYGIFLSLGAVLLDEITFGRYPGWTNLSKMLVAAFAEHLGYRQMVTFFKVKAFWDVVIQRRGWGRMERKGFRAPPGAELRDP